MKKAFVTKVFLIIAVLSGMAVGAFQISGVRADEAAKARMKELKEKTLEEKTEADAATAAVKQEAAENIAKATEAAVTAAPQTTEQGQDNAQTSGDNRRNEKNQRDRDRWDDDNDWDEQDDDDDDNDWDEIGRASCRERVCLYV